MSSATGQTAPTSSMRRRRSAQPTGRGFDVSSLRISSISEGIGISGSDRQTRSRRKLCSHSSTAMAAMMMATPSTSSNAVCSSQAIAGTPSAKITPTKTDLPRRDMHTGREGAERQQRENEQRTRRPAFIIWFTSRDEREFHRDQNRAPVQRLRHDEVDPAFPVLRRLPAAQ